VLFCAAFLLASLIMSMGLTAQVRTGISKENARHLWYVSYINDFGIGYVEWQYGELSVECRGSKVPVYLELTAQEWRSEGTSSRRVGSPLPGADRDIGHSGRSRRFRYAPGSTLSFYRLWHAINTSLESRRPAEEHILGQRSWADVRWTVSPGMIKDTMEVALYLVDAQSGTRLALLDSVGVHGSPSDVIARRYGSEPDMALNRRSLPDEYAGREVVIEPVPYRFGPTPFGLLFMKRFNAFNMSVLFERERHETFPGQLPRSEDHRFTQSIDSAYLHDLIGHYGTAFQIDSCPPALLCLYALDPGHQVALNGFLGSLRFRRNDPTCRHQAAADTAWWMATLETTSPTPGDLMANQPAPTYPVRMEADLMPVGCIAWLRSDARGICSIHLLNECCGSVSSASYGVDWYAAPPLLTSSAAPAMSPPVVARTR